MTGLLLQGGVIALFLGLGYLRPRAAQPLLGRHTLINVGTGLLLFLVRLSLVAWVAARAELHLLDLRALPGAVQLLLAFLLLDFTRYWVHRFDHRVPWLWTFHRVHHSSVHLDATAGLRMHLVDFLQLSAIPIVLFGLLFQVQEWVFTVAMGIGVVFDGFEHANLRIDYAHPFWRAWDRLFNNPHFHAWHHNAEGATRDGNYGNTLTIWDRLFGSDVTGPAPPEALGISDDQALQESILGLQGLRPRPAAEVGAATG